MTTDKHEDLSTQHWPVEIRLKQAEKALEVVAMPLCVQLAGVALATGITMAADPKARRPPANMP